MIRRSPAEYYIKYLLLLPDNLTDDDVVRTLREHHLDYPGCGYLSRLRASLRPPKPFYPMVETDLASYKFLQRHKVHRLFFRDAHVTTALELLGNARAKEVIESMILVEEPVFTTCTRLRRFGFDVHPKAVEYYEHFFMNTKLVDPTEMRALIALRVEDIALLGDDKETAIRYRAMKQAMYNDPRYMAVNAPVPALAAMRLQMRHGLKPNRLDHARLAEGVRMAALIAAEEAMLRGSPKAAMEARDYSVVAANMHALLQENGSEGSDLRKELIALGNDESTVPTIKQLTSGNFTDSIDLVEEAKHARR